MNSQQYYGAHPGTLSCTGIDGKTRTFYYRYYSEPRKKEYIFNVCDRQDFQRQPNNVFEMTVCGTATGALKVIMMMHHGCVLYSKRGIPESLIIEIASVLHCCIRSSSNKLPKDPSERRTNEATKVWKRLESNGLAKYDKDEDFYYLSDFANSTALRR